MEKRKFESLKTQNLNLDVSLKIASVNINGISKKLETIKIFFKSLKLDILCIQELHNCDQNYLQRWSKQNHMPIHINNEILKHTRPQNHYAGTAILTSQKVSNNFDVRHFVVEKNGTQPIQIIIGFFTLNIINCYFPQREKSRQKLDKTIDHFLKDISNHEIIIVGDVNFVQNEIDTLNKNLFKNTKDKRAFKKMRQNYDLLDIYRIYHKSKTLFPYRNPRGATRINRMYLTNQHKHYIKKFEYVPTMATDHLLSPVVTINLPIKIKWGSGLYCLNTSIISNIQFKTDIENFWQIWTQAKSNFETILEWWDMGKCLLKDLCKSFSIAQTKD